MRCCPDKMGNATLSRDMWECEGDECQGYIAGECWRWWVASGSVCYPTREVHNAEK